MGPFERSHQHGPPLLGRVRAPTRSPTSSLVCSPPTPSFPSASAPVVPCLRPTSLRALLLCHRRWPTARATRGHAARQRWVIGSPWAGLFTRRNEGLPGFWAVLFVRAVVEDPAGCGPLLAHLRSGRRRLQAVQRLGHPECHSFRGCMAHGPHVRVPTHRRARCRTRRKARYRPGRAHPWPGGFRTRWTTNRVS